VLSTCSNFEQNKVSKVTDANEDIPDNSDDSMQSGDATEKKMDSVESDSTAHSSTRPKQPQNPGQSHDIQNPPEDELPEYEPLTPELVEEEAIRGDFMLRWAAIFLAVLFGFSQIAETRTLVHIRSGDQMRATGFLPSSTDAFAYSLEGDSVANVSWLFDHIVSLAYSVGGEYGLTIFKALIAGIMAYFLSLISIPGMPTWWSSICCVFAIGACSVDFVPITDLSTLLGVTLVLLMLHGYVEGTLSGIVWKLPVLVAVWGNLDTRAYLGVTAVALFSVGLAIRKLFAQKDGDSPGAAVSALWKVAALCALGLIINPSPIASVLSIVTTYGTEYPTLAAMKPLTDIAALMDGRTEYFSIWSPAVQPGFEFAYLSGLSILIVAIVVLLISRSRDDIPFAIVMLGFAALAALKLHELPVASLVAAVAAGTAGQRWYRRCFRLDYTVEAREVLFSRGGRAVTVFAMAFLGFCIVADRLPTRTPVGMGFETDMRTTATSLGEQLAELPEEARILPTRMNQGDFLIWHGKKTFVDSRANLFGKYANETSLIHQFDVLRKSLLVVKADPATETTSPATEPEAAPDAGPERKSMTNVDWKPDYDKYGISHVMVRLAPPGMPAYPMAAAFLQAPNWELTERGPSALFFQFVKTQPLKPAYDSRDVAFRTSGNEKDPERFDFARPQDFYAKYLYASRPTQSAALREAQHFFVLDSQTPAQLAFNVAAAAANDPTNKEYMTLLGRILAGPMLTIRRANEALAIEPQNAIAHRLLGMAYIRLNELETAIVGPFGGNTIGYVRYMQAVMALRQSVVVDPNSPDTLTTLMNLYESQGRTGLAFECLEQYLGLEEERLLKIPEADEQLGQLYQRRTDWKELRDTVQEQMNAFIEQGMPTEPQEHAAQKLQMVEQLYNQGHVRLALNLAEDNIDLLRSQPQAELLRGKMLLEVGKLEDGYSVLNQLAAVAREQQLRPEFSTIQWHDSAAISQLAKGAYTSAIEIWEEQLALMANAENKVPELSQPIIRTLPLMPAVESKINSVVPNWPLLLIPAARVSLDSVPASRAAPTFLIAMANIESGNVAGAKFILEGMVTEGGSNAYRPVAEIYLSQLSDDATELITNSDLDAWEDFEFPVASADESTTDSTTSKTTTPVAPLQDNASETDKPTTEIPK